MSKVRFKLCTGWLKSHATRTHILIDGYSSVQFSWINKHAILPWLYKSSHRSRYIGICSSLSIVCQQAKWKDVFAQVQWGSVVEHYLVSCSYLTFQNEFRDSFSDSPLLNKLTVSHLVNCFHDTGTRHWVVSDMRKRVNEVDISNT
jgi:hypothetical protein